MSPVTPLDVLYEVMRSYQRPIMTNIRRSEYAEALIAVILRDHGWQRTTTWAGWDFEHPDLDLKLEVKQSAAMHPGGAASSPPRFSIRGRKRNHGRRVADLYVFAWHERTDLTTDHRDPTEWRFYVVLTSDLPDQHSIGLNRIKARIIPCSVADLGAHIEDLCSGQTFSIK